VRYHVGEPVVAVVARDKYLLEDAMELVDIDYEPLPVVVDSEEGLKPGAPLLYPEWGDNIIYHQRIQGGDAQRGFAEADLVVSERFRCHRTGAQPMETRGMLATYDEAQGLTLWLTTQRPHNIRDLLASYMQLPHDRVRVIQPRDMGSAFGSKAPFYREEIVASHLAMKLGQPVRWIENRMESLMNVGQERDQEGTARSLRLSLICNQRFGISDRRQQNFEPRLRSLRSIPMVTTPQRRLVAPRYVHCHMVHESVHRQSDLRIDVFA